MDGILHQKREIHRPGPGVWFVAQSEAWIRMYDYGVDQILTAKRVANGRSLDSHPNHEARARRMEHREGL